MPPADPTAILADGSQSLQASDEVGTLLLYGVILVLTILLILQRHRRRRRMP